MALESMENPAPAREPVGDVWRHTVARIPTVFGRLVYLASLRNPATGLYEHPELAQMCGTGPAADTIRRSHAWVFRDWLSLNLEQQKSDLEEYLAEQSRNRSLALEDWLRAAEQDHLVPDAAENVECQLFQADLSTVLSLLKRESGVASGPTA
jgi:hypothetical protein